MESITASLVLYQSDCKTQNNNEIVTCKLLDDSIIVSSPAHFRPPFLMGPFRPKNGGRKWAGDETNSIKGVLKVNGGNSVM